MDEVSSRFQATFARISARVDANVREQKERIAALAWCRENGDPHLPPTKQDNPHDQ